jgi:hypothetical protein
MGTPLALPLIRNQGGLGHRPLAVFPNSKALDLSCLPHLWSLTAKKGGLRYEKGKREQPGPTLTLLPHLLMMITMKQASGTRTSLKLWTARFPPPLPSYHAIM